MSLALLEHLFFCLQSFSRSGAGDIQGHCRQPARARARIEALLTDANHTTSELFYFSMMFDLERNAAMHLKTLSEGRTFFSQRTASLLVCTFASIIVFNYGSTKAGWSAAYRLQL